MAVFYVPLLQYGVAATPPGACVLPSSSPRTFPLLLCWSFSFCVLSSPSYFIFHAFQLYLFLTFAPLLGSGPLPLTSELLSVLPLGILSPLPSRGQCPHAALWQSCPLRSSTCLSTLIRTLPKKHTREQLYLEQS